MNHACPHCGEPVSRWRILRSVRVPGSLLKMPIRVMKCAACDGMVTRNLHPSEKWVTGMLEFWVLVIAVAWIAGGARSTIITAAIVGALIGVLVLRIRAQTAGWPRYRAYDPNEGN